MAILQLFTFPNQLILMLVAKFGWDLKPLHTKIYKHCVGKANYRFLVYGDAIVIEALRCMNFIVNLIYRFTQACEEKQGP